MRVKRNGNELTVIVSEECYNWLLENENKYVENGKYKVWVENGGFIVDGPNLNGMQIMVIAEKINKKNLKKVKDFDEVIGLVKLEGDNLKVWIEDKVYDYLLKNKFEYVVIDDYMVWNENGLFIVNTNKMFKSLNGLKIEVYREKRSVLKAYSSGKEVNKNNKDNKDNKKRKTLIIAGVICIGAFIIAQNVSSQKEKEKAVVAKQELIKKEAREKEEQEKKDKEEYMYILTNDKTYNEMVVKDGNVSKYSIGRLLENKDSIDKKYSTRIEELEKDYNKVKEAEERKLREEEEMRLKEEDERKLKEEEVEVTVSHKISSIKHGELLDVIITDKTAVIKTKIEPSYNNRATINQNGFNVEDIILNQGGDKFDEMQYWAVAKMSDGSESKVISFTLDKNQIAKVKNKTLAGSMIVEKAKDVWILPSLRE